MSAKYKRKELHLCRPTCVVFCSGGGMDGTSVCESTKELLVYYCHYYCYYYNHHCYRYCYYVVRITTVLLDLRILRPGCPERLPSNS